MPIYLLNESLSFPNPALADESGILAVGGDLSPARLMLAYELGIFPWYDESSGPILWHSPPWRMVLYPGELHVGRSLAKAIRRGRFELRYDTAFPQVITACASVPRAGQMGTWLNPDMKAAYVELHRRGVAHCAEAWLDGELVGGLYGVALGRAFFGESMFAKATDASKVVFVECIRRLEALGYTLIDCQVYTRHLASLGAAEIPRARFLKELDTAVGDGRSLGWP